MKRKVNRIVAVFMILSMLLGMAPVFQRSVQAASTSNVSVVSYRYNQASNTYDLMVTWNGPKTTKSIKVEYYTPETPTILTAQNVAVQEVEAVNPSVSRFTAVINAGSFRDDIIYGLNFTMYDNVNSTGNITTTGFLYFLTKMTFYSSRVEQIVDPDVYETGTKPELKLKWNTPKVWKGNTFVDANTALDEMKNSLGLTDTLNMLNYRINISTKAQTLDSGPDITPVTVDSSSGSYKAVVMGNEVAVNQAIPDEMSFNLLGRKDLQDTSLGTPPAGKLPHEQILPGTIYFMNIKPVFLSSAGTASIVTVGDPSKYNGSMVTDEDSNLEYTYTPVRFQLSRDASDNIYVKVYRINKDDGSLDMPNLYYSIQAIDIPSVAYGTDWPQKAKMTDEFFPNGSEYAITIISGVNPGTSMYYKVVVKTDSKKDRIESLKLQYQMSMDSSKPPVPVDVKADYSRSELNTGTVIDAVTGSEMVDQNGTPVIVKSTNTTLTWLKPKNWDSLTTAEKAELNFHILLNMYPDNLDIKQVLEVNGVEKEYLLNYRWVNVVNGDSTALKVSSDGQRLEYVLNGRELFKNSDGSDLNNPDKYPTYLMENRIYYVRMFTTKGYQGLPTGGFGGIVDSDGNGVLDDTDIRAVMNADDVSDKSITASFTTLPRVEREVPIATSFKAVSEDIDTTTGKNYVVLQFEKVNVDWTNYTGSGGNRELYDLYMSTSSDANASYVQIGSTDENWTSADTGVDKVEFVLINGKWHANVSGLKSNTTYYFKLKTRLDFGDPAMDDRVSAFTAIVPVTTRRGDVQNPDETARKPLAPTDFAIAVDAEGNLELTGSSVAFDWSRSESDVTYKLIATTSRIPTYAEEAEYQNDPYYQSFVAKFGDQVLNLNPLLPDGAFTFDALEQVCKYRVQEWMVPNSLYYFSLRAERKVVAKDENGQDTVLTVASAWVTLPITTSLIDAPQLLETVSDIQLGVQWTDSDATVKAEDYKIYIKESNETVYKQLGISQATIVKDDTLQQGVGQFYGRIRGLKASTAYNVRVYKGYDTGSITYQDLGSFTTRDDYHQVEVRWKGLPGYTYEIAIKEVDANEYVTLTSDHFDLLVQKDVQTLGTSYSMYYARIKQAPVSLIGGASTATLPLKSNMKYYIKVRAVQQNLQPSNYAGPVTARTQFNQDDYDDNEDLEDQKAKFIDRIEDLEAKLYWRVDMSNKTANKILLKGDRVVNALQNNGTQSVVIDLSLIAVQYKRDIIYIPAVVINHLNEERKVLTLKTSNAEYSFKPGTLKLENMQEVTDIKSSSKVKDLFFKVTITRSQYGTESLTTEAKPVSEINGLEMMAIGSSKTDAQLKEDFYNKVYNAETGLVKQKVDEITNFYNISASAVLMQGDYYINSLIEQVESELSQHIQNTLEGGYGIISMIQETKNVTEFTEPFSVTLLHSDGQNNFKSPYVMYDGTYEWQKVTANVISASNHVAFRVLKTGKYVITSDTGFAMDVPSDHWAVAYINSYGSKYDLKEVFGKTASFSPEASVSIKEVIILYEQVAGKTVENAGLDIKQRAKKLELDGIVNANAATRDLSRQEAASVLVRLYCFKEGLNPDRLLAKGGGYIKDDRLITNKHYTNVVTAIDLGLFTVNDNGEFLPDSYITRAQIITAMVRLLKLTGDL